MYIFSIHLGLFEDPNLGDCHRFRTRYFSLYNETLNSVSENQNLMLLSSPITDPIFKLNFLISTFVCPFRWKKKKLDPWVQPSRSKNKTIKQSVKNWMKVCTFCYLIFRSNERPAMIFKPEACSLNGTINRIATLRWRVAQSERQCAKIFFSFLLFFCFVQWNAIAMRHENCVLSYANCQSA